jgi:hypothetical protein
LHVSTHLHGTVKLEANLASVNFLLAVRLGLQRVIVLEPHRGLESAGAGARTAAIAPSSRSTCAGDSAHCDWFGVLSGCDPAHKSTSGLPHARALVGSLRNSNDVKIGLQSQPRNAMIDLGYKKLRQAMDRVSSTVPPVATISVSGCRASLLQRSKQSEARASHLRRYQRNRLAAGLIVFCCIAAQGVIIALHKGGMIMSQCWNLLKTVERPPRAAAAVGQRLRPRPGSIRCGLQQPRQELQHDQENNLMVLTLKVAMLAAAANAVAACYPHAAGATSWRPRRHAQRRLASKYQSQETPAQVGSPVWYNTNRMMFMR